MPAELGTEVAGRGSLYRVVGPSLLRDYPWGEKPFFASGRRESPRSARELTDVYLETLREIGEGGE